VILARVSAGTWQQLAPIAGPTPKSSAHPGHVHVVQNDTARPGHAQVVQNDTAHPTQLLLMTGAEAADWLTTTAAGKSWS